MLGKHSSALALAPAALASLPRQRSRRRYGASTAAATHQASLKLGGATDLPVHRRGRQARLARRLLRPRRQPLRHHTVHQEPPGRRREDFARRGAVGRALLGALPPPAPGGAAGDARGARRRDPRAALRRSAQRGRGGRPPRRRGARRPVPRRARAPPGAPPALFGAVHRGAAALLDGSFLTPNALFFVRNHHPVPHLDGATTRSVGGVGAGGPPLTLDELKALPRTTVVATAVRRQPPRRAQRRAQDVGQRVGLRRDLDRRVDRRPPPRRVRGARAGQPTPPPPPACATSSSRATTASRRPSRSRRRLSHGDVLLAYEMNGEPLPADHGYPLRAVVPGHVGVRNVKWLKSVTAAADVPTACGSGASRTNRSAPPSRRSTASTGGGAADAGDSGDAGHPAPRRRRLAGRAGATSLEVSGIAYSGGGRAIIRVDVSADGGRTWTAAELGEGADQPLSKAWAWTLWTADALPPPKEGGAPTSTSSRVPRGGRVVHMQPASVADTRESARAGEQRGTVPPSPCRRLPTTTTRSAAVAAALPNSSCAV